MEEQLFDKIPGLEKLLLSRAFGELTNREKEEILQHMSAEDYDTFRKTVLESRRFFDSESHQVQADPEIRKELLARLERSGASKKYSIASALERIISLRIPAYQPVLAIVLLVIFFMAVHNGKREIIRYMTKTDTVYLEKKRMQNSETQSQQVVPELTKKQHDVIASKATGARNPDHPPVHSGPSQNQYVQNAYQKIKIVNLVRVGSNANEDSSLMKFLVTCN